MDFGGFRKAEHKNLEILGGYSKRARKESKAKKTIDQYFEKVHPKNKTLGEESQTYNGLEQFENYKKLVKIEERKENSSDISRILFKKSLRERFERVSCLQTVPQLLAIPQYSLLSKVFSLLDFMLNKQSKTFQEIILQFQDYEIEFKVQHLQKIMSIWPESYTIFWKQISETWTLVLGIEENTQRQEERINKFNIKLLKYIQNHGEYIELHPLPLKQNQDDFETINKPLHLQYQQIPQQIALELQKYFQIRNVSNMYWSNVERYIQKLSLIKNKISFLECINQLIDKFPDWIAIVSGADDKIIRVNMSLDIGIMIMENACLECY